MIYKRFEPHSFGYDIIEVLVKRDDYVYYVALNSKIQIDFNRALRCSIGTLEIRYKPMKIFECLCGARPRLIERTFSDVYLTSINHTGIHHDGVKCWSCA